MNIRPSSSTGVLFAVVHNNTVPLSVAVVTKGEDVAVSLVTLWLKISTCVSTCLSFLNQCTFQNLQVFLHDASVATLDTVMLCYPDRLMVQLNVTPTEILISADSSSVTYMESSALQKELEYLNSTMQNPVSTYIGGIPG